MLSLNQEPQQADLFTTLIPEQAYVIQELNDQFRTAKATPHLLLGEWSVCEKIQALPWNERREIIKAVKEYRGFIPEEDFFGHRIDLHDLGRFTVGSRHFEFNIDILTLDGEHESPDPTNPFISYWSGLIKLVDEDAPWLQ